MTFRARSGSAGTKFIALTLPTAIRLKSSWMASQHRLPARVPRPRTPRRNRQPPKSQPARRALPRPSERNCRSSHGRTDPHRRTRPERTSSGNGARGPVTSTSACGYTGTGAAALLCVLATVFGYLKLDMLSRAKHRRSLQAGAAGVILAVALVAALAAEGRLGF